MNGQYTQNIHSHIQMHCVCCQAKQAFYNVKRRKYFFFSRRLDIHSIYISISIYACFSLSLYLALSPCRCLVSLRVTNISINYVNIRGSRRCSPCVCLLCVHALQCRHINTLLNDQPVIHFFRMLLSLSLSVLSYKMNFLLFFICHLHVFYSSLSDHQTINEELEFILLHGALAFWMWFHNRWRHSVVSINIHTETIKKKECTVSPFRISVLFNTRIFIRWRGHPTLSMN